MNHRCQIHSLIARTVLLFVAVVVISLSSSASLAAPVIGDLVDASDDFRQPESTYFIAGTATKFDAKTGAGELRWQRHNLAANISFNKIDRQWARAESNEFPVVEYDRDPELPFDITFVSPRTVRLRFASRALPLADGESLMLAGPVPKDGSWRAEEKDGKVTYTSAAGQIELTKDPWKIRIYDADHRLVTETQTLNDPVTYSTPTPFAFVRRARDLGHSMAATFHLAPDEKIFGCGESFTRLDKRGQKVVLYVRDAMGVQSQRMYKPIPFFLSSRGYGMFVHTSAPTTFDFGHDYDQSNTISVGDEVLDLFIFLGDPKQVLSEYTAITGRSPTPPLWSFGLWMSRITYKSEAEVRDVAAKLREHKIPSDVIHLDTGWFETDWQCDYKFAESRFDDPKKMIADLGDQGFHISLWQLPYFSSKNELYKEGVAKGYFVRNENGELPYEEGVLDFTNADAKKWYENLLAGLLEMGVGAIKVDFGEDGPLRGLYAAGRTGWYEHNLYPLRYNKTVADLTEKISGEHIIWARSAWAGSQRYPLHWGGDSENTDSAMAATLRAGLSFGLCGFTYWSHDAGGFVGKSPRELYRRWLPFAALTSHTRCHGAPPREPWGYDDEFVADFRRALELRYSLLPYIYSQARNSSERGYPMLRTLFFEFPNDPTSWLIEDEYMLGSDLLVAPLFTNDEERSVYLPPGRWIDYQTEKLYEGSRWHTIKVGKVPIVLLAREGAAIPIAAIAQSTKDIKWNDVELRVFGAGGEASGLFALPDGAINELKLSPSGGAYKVNKDPLNGNVKWRVTTKGDGS